MLLYFLLKSLTGLTDLSLPKFAVLQNMVLQLQLPVLPVLHSCCGSVIADGHGTSRTAHFMVASLLIHNHGKASSN